VHAQFHIEAGYVGAVWRNVLIHQWVDEVTLTSLAAGREGGSRIVEALGPRIAVLTIFASEVRLPTVSVRKQAAIDMRETRDRVVAAATVIEGRGFRAGALRGAYATLMIASRARHPSKVVETVPEAAELLTRGLEYETDAAAELCDVVRQVRGVLDERRASSSLAIP
jgi:hypothetical protein